MSELIQKFPRDVDILVERLLHEEEMKGMQHEEIAERWEDGGAYIFGFCSDIELVSMFPQYSVFTDECTDLLAGIPAENIYKRLAKLVATNMSDVTLWIGRLA